MKIAPGVGTGLFAWAKDEHAHEAHCYRKGYGTDVAICRHKFGSRIELPHERDKLCGTCRAKIAELESALAARGHGQN